MKLTELKLLCRGCGLRATGKKSVLIKRLQDYIEQQQQELLQHQHKMTTITNSNNKLPFELSSVFLHSSSSDTLSSTPSTSVATYSTSSSTGELHENVGERLAKFKNHSFKTANNVEENRCGRYMFLLFSSGISLFFLRSQHV